MSLRDELEAAIAARFTDNATHWSDFDPFIVSDRKRRAPRWTFYGGAVCNTTRCTITTHKSWSAGLRGIEAATDLANAVRKGRTVRAQDIIDAIDRTIADLQTTRAIVTQAMIRAHRDSDDGFGTGAGEVAVSSSKIPDRATAEHALQPKSKDPVRERAYRLCAAVAGAQGMSSLAYANAHSLLALSNTKADAIIAELNGGPAMCANCQATVWRTSADRLRAGRCTPCYQYRRRNSGAERPRELWATSETA